MKYLFPSFWMAVYDYSFTIWPGQIFLALFALICFGLIFFNIKFKNKIIALSVSLLFLWCAIVFFYIIWGWHADLSSVFAVLFIVQSLLIIFNVIRDKFDIKFENTISDYLGFFFVFYSLILNILISFLFTHKSGLTIQAFLSDMWWKSCQTIGLPSATAIFFLGILFFDKKKTAKYLLIIPFIWLLSLFLFNYYMPVSDILMLFFYFLGCILIYIKDRRNTDLNNMG